MAWRTFGSGRSSSSVVFTVEELDSTEKQFLSDAAEKEDATTPTKFDVDMGGQVSGSKSTTRQVGCFRKVKYRTEGLLGEQPRKENTTLGRTKKIALLRKLCRRKKRE